MRPRTQTARWHLPTPTDSYVQAATSLVKCGQAAGDQGRDYFDRAMKVLKKGVENTVIRKPRILIILVLTF